jgi:hypothetical protein
MEEEEALKMFGGEGCPSMPPSCYNRSAWMKNWQEYWKLLAARYEGAEHSAWFAMFDIANFYDSVDLNHLESCVRATAGEEHLAINVLFHLLGSWNRGLRLYTPTAKGLPMDLVGDCSRLLANFFLASFDRPFREYVLNNGGDFMRFADDMVVCATSEETCRQLVFEASTRLHEVTYCSKRDFERYWGFSVMGQFEAGNVVDGLRELQRRKDDDQFGRRSTALKRAITIVDREPGLRGWRTWVRDAVLGAKLELQLSREQLHGLVRLYDDTLTGLGQIVPIFLDQPFTQPLAILLRLLETFSRDTSSEVRQYCQSAIRRVEAIGDPVLEIAVRHLRN